MSFRRKLSLTAFFSIALCGVNVDAADTAQLGDFNRDAKITCEGPKVSEVFIESKEITPGSGLWRIVSNPIQVNIDQDGKEGSATNVNAGNPLVTCIVDMGKLLKSQNVKITKSYATESLNSSAFPWDEKIHELHITQNDISGLNVRWKITKQTGGQGTENPSFVVEYKKAD